MLQQLQWYNVWLVNQSIAHLHTYQLFHNDQICDKKFYWNGDLWKINHIATIFYKTLNLFWRFGQFNFSHEFNIVLKFWRYRTTIDFNKRYITTNFR